MKKTSYSILIILLLFLGCSDNHKQNDLITDLDIRNLFGKIKTVKTEVFDYYQQNDSLIIGDKINSYSSDRNETLDFNELGYLISRKEFYSNDKISYEEKYEYDTHKRLKKKNKTDHYGKGSKMSNQYFYNQSDSIVKSIIIENDFQLIILGERDTNNRLFKRTNLVNDTIQRTFTFKYDYNGNVIEENSYQKMNIPSKLISRVFEKNLLKTETILEFVGLDTLSYQNIYEYDINERISIIKSYYSNESNHILISKIYDNNSNLIEEKHKPIGAVRYSTLIYKWDEYGNRIEHSRTDSETEEKDIWISKYTFDKFENWITKENFKNDSPLSILKRKIIYY